MTSPPSPRPRQSPATASESKPATVSASEAVEAAPEPTKSEKAKIYRTTWPTDRFVVEDLPVVTTEGVPLTQAQAKKVLAVADSCGVTVEEVESE